MRRRNEVLLSKDRQRIIQICFDAMPEAVEHRVHRNFERILGILKVSGYQ